MESSGSSAPGTLAQFEAAVLTSPYSLKSWLALLGHVVSCVPPSPVSYQIGIHERSVAALPTSYKLWNLYAQKSAALAKEVHPEHPCREHALSVSVRAARALPHCPGLWERAVRAHIQERKWSVVRPLVDEAIKYLPVTLHGRFWRFSVQSVLDTNNFLQLGAHFLTRAQMLNIGGDGAVELFRVLRDAGDIDGAVRVLSNALLIPSFGGDDRRDLWMELVNLVSKHPAKCLSVNVTDLIRSAIGRSEADVGELWVALAGVNIRLGRFRNARAVFEEALASAPSVRDFTVVFDAYAKFLDTLVMEALNNDESDESSDESSESDRDAGSQGKNSSKANMAATAKQLVVEDDEENAVLASTREEELQALAQTSSQPSLKASPDATGILSGPDNSALNDNLPWEDDPEALMTDLEALTNRRPFLLSDVCLRQNPHNVHEWHKRARLYANVNDLEETVSVYTEAVRVVDPWRSSHGRPHTLWLAFAQLYEKSKDISSARQVLDKAVSDPERFKTSEDLAAIWCEYAEMELREGLPAAARDVLKRATTQPPGSESRRFKKADPTQAARNDAAGGMVVGMRRDSGISYEYNTSSPAWLFWKSLRSWSFYVDVIESFESPEEVLALHERMLDLRIATVQMVVNGASFLESRRLFELSFRLLDRATSTFSWPEVMNVWIVYLTKFVARYGKRKVERVRDLFEQAIKEAPVTHDAKSQAAPSEELRTLYIMYANVEERFGLPRHAMSIYARATKSVRRDQRASMYRLYVVRVCELFGVSRARQVYEDALDNLDKREEIMEFSQRFAQMEVRLGEIDRARAIYAHGAEVALPHAGPAFASYWANWNAFELEHGTEDTFRDMLRQKRHVQMKNAGVHLLTSAAAGARTVEAASRIESDRRASHSEKEKSSIDHAENLRGQPGENAMSALEDKVRAARAVAARDELPSSGSNPNPNAEELDVGLNDDDNTDSEMDGSRDEEPEREEHKGSEDASELQPAIQKGAMDATGVVTPSDGGGRLIEHDRSRQVSKDDMVGVHDTYPEQSSREMSDKDEPGPDAKRELSPAVVSQAEGDSGGVSSMGGTLGKRPRVESGASTAEEVAGETLGARERLRRARKK